MKMIEPFARKFRDSIKCFLRDGLQSRGYSLIKSKQHRELIEIIEYLLSAGGDNVLKLPVSSNRTSLLMKLEGTSPAEALFVIHHLHQSLVIDGDVCEFGVAQGRTSALLADELTNSNKHLWLFDSFEGLGRPSSSDVLIDDIFGLGAMERYEGTMSYSMAHVLQSLAEVAMPRERVHIVKGFIERLPSTQSLPERVCFAYVDFDFYDPIKTCLQLLHHRVSRGSTIIVDDYGFFSAGAQKAVDEFIQQHELEYTTAVPPRQFGHFMILVRN